jgi:hypothetical protein
MSPTAVRVNTTTYATTHVATNMLKSIRQIAREAGLDTTHLNNNWAVLENGVSTWLRSGHLQSLVLEVFDTTLATGKDLVGRFDFVIDYGYYGDGNGELWLDPDTVSYAVRKNGSYPSRCSYRLVADTLPGEPTVPGWSETTFRSTDGFTRHTVGAAIGGGSLGATLAYYKKTS